MSSKISVSVIVLFFCAHSICYAVEDDSLESDVGLEDYIFSSHLAKRIWGARLDPEYSVSITKSTVTYYYDKRNEDESLELTTDLEGVDISFNTFFDNWHGLELGIYQGSTSALTLEEDRSDSEVRKDTTLYSLSDVTDMEEISTVGVRSALIGGWNVRDAGFRAYGGLGVYFERTEINKVSAATVTDYISGVAIKWGLGYSWEVFALEFWGSTRSGQPVGFQKSSGQGGWRVSYNF